MQQCTDAPILISYLSHLVKVTKLFSRFWVIVFRISCDKVIFLPILFPCMQRNEEVARRAAENPPVKCRNCVTIITRTSERGSNGELGNPDPSDIGDDAERKMCLISQAAFFPRDVSIQAQYQNKRERKKPAIFHHQKKKTHNECNEAQF